MAKHTSGLTLNDRDVNLLETLTLRVRVLSISQVVRVWWPDSVNIKTAAHRRLSQLEAAGYVELFPMMAHPEVTLSEPLCSWKPGESSPDFGALAWLLQSRWNEELVNTHCVISTDFAGRFFGGYGGRKPRRAETTHDLHLSSVFLQMRTNQPDRAATWISEDARKKDLVHGEKLPDAIVSDGDSQIAIELGGKSYDRRKLEEFHEHCDERNLAYEVW